MKSHDQNAAIWEPPPAKLKLRVPDIPASPEKSAGPGGAACSYRCLRRGFDLHISVRSETKTAFRKTDGPNTASWEYASAKTANPSLRC